MIGKSLRKVKSIKEKEKQCYFWMNVASLYDIYVNLVETKLLFGSFEAPDQCITMLNDKYWLSN